MITSFSGLVANKSDLLKQNFDYIILDEGHKIRNPDAQITLAVKEFPTSHRIILSGRNLKLVSFKDSRDTNTVTIQILNAWELVFSVNLVFKEELNLMLVYFSQGVVSLS